MTNRHDKRRKDQIIKTLHKARDQIETATLYLGVQEPRPMQEIYAMDDALEHVNQALERLGVTLDEGGEVLDGRNDS